MTKELIDLLLIIVQSGAVLVSVLSAGAWAWASHLGCNQQPAGYDNHVAAAREASRQAQWNALGAALAAVSALLQAVAIFLTAYASATLGK